MMECTQSPSLSTPCHPIWITKNGQEPEVKGELGAEVGVILQHSSGNLWIEDPFERSLADRWIDWASTALQPSFMRLFWGYYRTPKSQRNLVEIQSAIESCQQHFRALDSHLSSHDYLAGSRFTAADIPAGTALHRYFSIGLPVEEPTNVMAWFARLRERPAFCQNILVPFDELYGRLAF